MVKTCFMRKYCTSLVVFFTLLMSKYADAQITCPADFEFVTCYSGFPVSFTGDHAATAPGGTIVYSFTMPNGTVQNGSSLDLPLGVNTVTATATFTGGSTSSCTFKVTVVSLPAYTMTPPADFTFVT